MVEGCASNRNFWMSSLLCYCIYFVIRLVTLCPCGSWTMRNTPVSPQSSISTSRTVSGSPAASCPSSSTGMWADCSYQPPDKNKQTTLTRMCRSTVKPWSIAKHKTSSFLGWSRCSLQSLWWVWQGCGLFQSSNLCSSIRLESVEQARIIYIGW